MFDFPTSTSFEASRSSKVLLSLFPEGHFPSGIISSVRVLIGRERSHTIYTLEILTFIFPEKTHGRLVYFLAIREWMNAFFG